MIYNDIIHVDTRIYWRYIFSGFRSLPSNWVEATPCFPCSMLHGSLWERCLLQGLQQKVYLLRYTATVYVQSSVLGKPEADWGGGGGAHAAGTPLYFCKLTYFSLKKCFSANYKTLNFCSRCQENAYLALWFSFARGTTSSLFRVPVSARSN